MSVFVFLVALAASTVGGICGIGGGVVMKPALDALGALSVSTISFLSGCTVLTMSIVSVLRSRKGGALEVRRSIPIGIGAALGGLAGKESFTMLSRALGQDQMVGVIQSALLFLMVLGTMVYLKNKARIHTKNVKNLLLCAVIGFLLGVLSSFLGIGGGPMNLVVLYYFFSMDTKKAAKNSLLIILLSQAASFMQTAVLGRIPAFEWPVLLAMIAAAVIGGLLGARIHKKVPAAQAEKLLTGLLTVILALCVYNAARLLLA